MLVVLKSYVFIRNFVVFIKMRFFFKMLMNFCRNFTNMFKNYQNSLRLSENKTVTFCEMSANFSGIAEIILYVIQFIQLPPYWGIEGAACPAAGLRAPVGSDGACNPLGPETGGCTEVYVAFSSSWAELVQSLLGCGGPKSVEAQ